jgi:hypothetical protein
MRLRQGEALAHTAQIIDCAALGGVRATARAVGRLEVQPGELRPPRGTYRLVEQVRNGACPQRANSLAVYTDCCPRATPGALEMHLPSRASCRPTHDNDLAH